MWLWGLLVLIPACGASSLDTADLAARWKAAIANATALTSQMTVAELNNVTYGISTACSGLTGGVPRLNFDGLCYNDILKSDLSNGYAEGISIGASWNKKLAYARGVFMGAESRRKGVKVILTPVIEPIGRMALNGRNMEGFGADPVLAGKLAGVTISGLQKSVISSVKHYLAYEQETYRNPTAANEFSVSSNLNDKDMHELYLWAYQDAVKAGVGCVMCSYNRINETYACENNKTLNGLLKSELNFPGFVLSDWGAQHSGVPSALGGLDVAMPNSAFWENGALAAAVSNGSLPRARLQDMATRQIAASFFIYGSQTSSPPNGYGLQTDYLAPHRLVEARDPKAKPNLLQQAVEGHVLVKNTNNALPLRKPKILSLFGYDGHVQPVNGPQVGLENYLWSLNALNVNASFNTLVAAIAGQVETLPQTAAFGTYSTATGSGSSLPAYISDPYSAISQRAYDDDIYLWWDFSSPDPAVSQASSACLVFLNDFSTESEDRSGLADPTSDQLVLNVANQCANTIVVIHNPFIRILDAFYNHPNVTAILLAHLPGQDSGRGLVKVLFGDVSPSGRLPYTIAKQASDYGPLLNASYLPQQSPQSNLSDPSGFDYRYFQAQNIVPRVPFGFGMSYTTFNYSGAHISLCNYRNASTAPPQPDTLIPGGVKSLFDTLATITINVTNTGNYTAAEVVQLYVQFPNETIHVLRGFEKHVIPINHTKEYAIELDRRDLSRWDVVSQQWLLPNGTTTVMIGSSSADIKASVNITRS